MKFILFITILLAFTMIDSSRVNRHRRSRLSHRANNNSFYQFMLGLLSEVSGDPKFIDECSQKVPGWEQAGPNEEKNDGMGTDLKNQTTIYEKAISLIKKAVDMVCEFKDDIVKYLTGAKRRYIRLFIMGKISRRFSWNVTDLISSAANGISKAANAISTGITKAKDTVIDGVKWVGKKVEDVAGFLKKQLTEWFKPVFDLIDEMKARVTKFLKEHPFLAQVLLFFKCFYENKGVQNIKAMFENVKKFIEFIPSLATVAGWIKLVANLICAHEKLADIVANIKKGLGESNKPVRYNLFGKALGKFITVVIA